MKTKLEELKPIIKTNLADIIIEQITTLIKEEKLKVGERFFSERQLAEQFNVSRVTVREAIKRLMQKGFLISGNRNSLTISKPTPEDLIDLLMEDITLDEKDNKNLIEVRRVLETYAATIAIDRASKTDIEELSQIIKNMEKNINNSDIFSDYDYFFHIKISQATNNPILFNLLKSIRRIMREEIKELAKFEKDRKEALRLHKEVLEGLIKKDSELVNKSIYLHFCNVEECSRRLELQRKKKKKEIRRS